MIIFRFKIAVALLLSMYAFPSFAFPAVGSTVSSTYTEVSSCSELASRVDRNVCSHHLAAFKALIREKNNQISSTTPSPTRFPSISQKTSINTSSDISLHTPPIPVSSLSLIPETVMIRKISATSERLNHEVFETFFPTLFIFDAEQSHGNKQPAVYELPLPEAASVGHEGGAFHLPDNSAFVGNGADILPEFVTQGVLQDHYVMSATHSNSVYYLANIKVDSRNPLVVNSSSTMALSGSPESTPTKQSHVPAGVLNLMGAGIFVANNVKVVLDPADNQMRIKTVKLGCKSFAGGKRSEVNFVYRFINSEFDLLRGLKGRTDFQNAALNVECSDKTGRVQLTMKNTKTVLSLPTDTAPLDSPQSSAVLFAINLWPGENALSFVDSICNSVVDQLGNDLSIDLAHPSDPDHYMGGIRCSSDCSDIGIIQGAFGLKDREHAWGLMEVDDTGKHVGMSVLEGRYQVGFAPVSAWSEAGLDVACNCTMSAPASSSSLIALPCTAQLANASITDGSDSGEAGFMVNENDNAGSYENQRLKVVVVFSLLTVDQVITNTWFYFSYRIKQNWIRYTSQTLAAILGLGIPGIVAVEMKNFISALRMKDLTVVLVIEPK
ncbi:hypothetical protein [Endozoicomonas sp. 8E]|uniref:hypothetical protein n=1 Tax=Endozoicomonas sp. 8E TaxID=3035692 RepID=UPI0029391C19|nr:hypothetical protein [Endozoicomonas sp. 8E]WOG29700.1 hypothetical protein P6910_08610 [Endozoicomonas sp. 8E]